MGDKMLSIFKYLDASQFLRDSWEEKRKNNPAFSMRSWARTLGLASHAPLNLMLAKKRPMPKKYVPKLIQSLNLNKEEGLYLETLIDLDRTKTLAEKEYYLERLKTLSPEKQLNLVEVEEFKLLSDPIHTIILEMTNLKNFQGDPKWIQSVLHFPITISRIEKAIERLVNMGLLSQSSDGIYIKTNQHIAGRVDVEDLGCLNYHKTISQLAAGLVSKQNLNQREYNSYSLNINKKDIYRAKIMMREFIDKFINEIEATKDTAEETYQFNMQFFEITKASQITKEQKKTKCRNQKSNLSAKKVTTSLKEVTE